MSLTYSVLFVYFGLILLAILKVHPIISPFVIPEKKATRGCVLAGKVFFSPKLPSYAVLLCNSS